MAIEGLSRKLRTWRFLIGTGRKLSKESVGSKLIIPEFYRGVKRSGFWEYLGGSNPKTIEEVIDRFGIQRKDYLHRVFDLLVDKQVLTPMLNDLGERAYCVNKRQLKKWLKLSPTYEKSFAPFFESSEKHELIMRYLQGKRTAFASRDEMIKWYKTLSEEFHKTGRELLMTFGGKESFRGKHILDLGCGFGDEIQQLYERFDGDCRITGIDFDSSLVEIAKRREVYDQNGEIKRLGDLQNVRIIAVDPGKPFPLDDESVDTVFCFAQLYWPKPEQQKLEVSESCRVLRAGGKLLVAGVFDPNHPLVLWVKPHGGHGHVSKSDFTQWCKEGGLKKQSFGVLGGLFVGEKSPIDGS